MSVFTTVSVDELNPWLSAYPLGTLLELQGIASGISNTNYFVTTIKGRYVLTLFEEHSADELPYFLNLMKHLAERGVPCPHPVMRSDGVLLDELNGKPAALVTCLRGRDITEPSVTQCAELGRVLANMHVAGASFNGNNHDSRDVVWREATAKSVFDLLSADDQAILAQTMQDQADLDIQALPQGVIHADLFRDNVLFDGDEIGGVIDFYYACRGAYLYDVAISVNDWCVDADGSLDARRVGALLKAYHAVRPFTPAEQSAWPIILPIAALRFWLSRLKDKHYPQAGELTHAKDPQHFKKILQWGITHQAEISAMWV
ncbi:MAG: homoserine kinase [Candidatus Methylopumilus sp.]|jgi:homoserine kinase type II|nr:homoserine kinase [Candidatus Methylopumilus sp.]